MEAGKGPVLHLADVVRCYFQEAALSLHLLNVLSDSTRVLLFLVPRETQTRLSPRYKSEVTLHNLDAALPLKMASASDSCVCPSKMDFPPHSTRCRPQPVTLGETRTA